MGYVTGCFTLFPLPSGIPGFGELGELLLASVKAEMQPVEEELPEIPVLTIGGVDAGPALAADVPIHPFFTGEGKAVRGYGRPRAGNYDPAVALVMHYNVDSLTPPKIEFIGAQAAALKLDLIHLLDTRVSASAWPSVKAKLTSAFAGTNMKWLFRFFEGGMGGPGKARCTIGGQIICFTNRLSAVTCEPVVKLGAAVCIKFNLNKIQYASIGTYWPCPNNEAGSFQAHIEAVI